MLDLPPFEVVRGWAEQRFPERSWPWPTRDAPAPDATPRRLTLTTRVAAGASAGLLALGVAIGMASGPGPQATLAAQDPIVVVGPATPAPAPAVAPPSAPAAATPATPVTPTVEAAPVTEIASTPATEPVAVAAPVTVDDDDASSTADETATDDDTSTDDETTTGDDATPRSKLPAIDHVLVVWMADGRSERTFGPQSPLPYVATTLAAQGLVLPRYSATGHGTLTNAIAFLGGLGPTAAQQADCPVPTPVAPATPGDDGQVSGDGCVLPEQVPSLLGQLTGAGRTWRVYAGDLAASGADSCRAPVLDRPDPAGLAPRPGDAFATARVPALWFASVTAQADCGGVVDLSLLDRDLAAPDQVSDFSLVVPSVCDAGAEVVCPDGRPSGPAAANAFLESLIPKLTANDAFAKDGLIVVVWDQAPASGPFADARACCSGRPAALTGGGRTGAVLLSPHVEPGTVLQKPYDHVALLRSIEDLFGLERLGYAARPEVQGFGPRVFGRSG